METVLPAIIVIMIMLYATLTQAYSFASAQARIQAGQSEMQARLNDQSRTDLTAISAVVSGDGSQVDAIFLNSGTTRLTDFDQWDLIVQYYDTTHGSHVIWVPFYSGGSPTVQEWSVVGLYMDGESSQPEVYERGILNPGEELVIQLRLPVQAKEEVAGMVTISTANGVTTPIFFVRPKPKIQ